jgi:hypothetical protein
MKAFGPLKVGDHVKQVPRLRISLWAEHAHQTLRGRMGQVAQLVSVRGVDYNIVSLSARVISLSIKGHTTSFVYQHPRSSRRN